MRYISVLCCLLASFLITSNSFAGEEKIKDKLTIGFVYVSPIGEEGWSYQHDVARKQLAEDPSITTYFVESVKEGADAERVMLNMARKDFDIIVAASFGFMDPSLKVAARYPNTVFLNCSGYKTADNVSNFFGRMYQARYLTGVLAGRMTKSNIIGYVAAFPIPEVIRGINAFTLGVRSVNPEAEVRVVWSKTWYDPIIEKEAAKSLLDVGADIITQHQDSPGALIAAEERGAYSIGYNSDMSKIVPKSHLASAVWNWVPYYEQAIRDVRSGTWKSSSYWAGIETGIVDIEAYGSMVPDTVKQEIASVKQSMIDASFSVFQGPIKNQKGEVTVPAGVSLTDKELLEFNWFVEGVVGSPQ